MADLNKYISNADAKVKLYEVRERVKGAEEVELRDILKNCERELFDLRTQAMLQQLPNPMRIRHVRKLIARVQTELSARQSQKVAA